MPKKEPFTSKETEFFKALNEQKVPFMIIGLSAATLQGAPVVTQDIDIWVKNLGDPEFAKAVRKVGGIYIPPFGMNPPQIAGEGLELLDLVVHVHGLKDFEKEYAKAIPIKIGKLTIKALPLERIIASKENLGREKDQAVLPALRASMKVIKSQKK